MLRASILLDFDPGFRIAGLELRWETIAVAGVILLSLTLAALLAGRTPAAMGPSQNPGTSPLLRRLSRVDLLYIACGAAPGAVVGGRAGYVIAHVDYYQVHTANILDLTQGSLSLSLAVVGGTVTAAIVARLFGTPIVRWLHVAAIPLLLAIGLGKLAMVTGGSGQGLFTDVDWATAYVGPGPWGSLAPQIASYPSQALEGLLALFSASLLVLVALLGGFRGQDGQLFFTAIALWGIGRAGTAFTWRDPVILGPLSAEQLLTIAVTLVALALALGVPRRRPSTPADPPPLERPAS